MSHIKSVRREEAHAARQHARPSRKEHAVLSLHNNRTRRLLTRAAYAGIVLLVGVLAVVNLRAFAHMGSSLGLRLPLFILGFATLPLLYHLARYLGASRPTALWAMALLGASVPWLLLLRKCETCALMPLLITLAALCYTRVLERKPGAWLSLGLTAAALFLDNPWTGLGLALGLGAHAAGWVRGREAWQPLLQAGGVFLAGVLALVLFPPLGGLAWNLSPTVTPPQAFLAYLLMLNAWVLPILAVPLLWLALFTDPAHRWRVNPVAALPALIITAVLLVAGAAHAVPLLRVVIALAPLAALWLALGFARLQARTPAWVWAPVAVMLVITTVPHSVVRWGSQAAGLHRLLPERTIATRLETRDPELLVPLVHYVKEEISGGGMAEM